MPIKKNTSTHTKKLSSSASVGEQKETNIAMKTPHMMETLHSVAHKEWEKEESLRLSVTALDDGNLEMIKGELVNQYGDIILIQ
jgi:hypothetical protein